MSNEAIDLERWPAFSVVAISYADGTAFALDDVWHLTNALLCDRERDLVAADLDWLVGLGAIRLIGPEQWRRFVVDDQAVVDGLMEEYWAHFRRERIEQSRRGRLSPLAK